MEWLRLSQLSLGPQLGRGAFCEVHLATLERTKEQVAIKRVRRDLRPGSQRDLAVRDLKTELDVLLQIEPHSHVVRLLGRGTDGDSTFVVLEVVPETFTQRWEAWKAMRHQFLPEPLASKVAWFFGASGCCGGCASRRRVVWRAQLGAGRDLASALAHLHRGNRGYKVLYRDLKPSNIGFDGDRLVLYDFGLAKIVPASPGGGKKQHGDRYKLTPETGSTRFMAPEVAKGDFYDESADVYSFAILLWQILSLEIPFAKNNPATHRLLVVDGDLRPPIDPKWSDNIAQLLTFCWARSPDDRLTADAVRNRLDAELRSLDDDRDLLAASSTI